MKFDKYLSPIFLRIQIQLMQLLKGVYHIIFVLNIAHKSAAVSKQIFSAFQAVLSFLAWEKSCDSTRNSQKLEDLKST